MIAGRFGAFARLAAIFGLILLVLQLFLVWLYIRDRDQGEDAGYRFPLPERVIAMADLVEAASDPRDVLIALNSPELLVTLIDEPVASFAPAEARLEQVDRLFDDLQEPLAGRDVAVFVALPPGTRPDDFRRRELSIFTRFPMRIAIDLHRGGALVVETRDDLLTQVYSVPVGWWSGIFAATAALIVLLALHVETRPLVRLAEAAGRFGKLGKPQHVKPAGSREMRLLIETFNGMQAGLEEQLTRRRVMLGALGHDLRTHLTRLGLKLEEPDREDVDTLRGDVDQIARILENCLALAREDAALDVVPVELNGLVAAVAGEARAGAVAFVPQGEVFALANAAAVERIVENVLDNALKFGTQARVEVSGGPPTITVSDDGPGLSEPEMARVLDPFEVLDAARTQGKGGSGLGLTICRMLAEAQGGRFEIGPGYPEGLRAVLELRGLSGAALPKR